MPTLTVFVRRLFTVYRWCSVETARWYELGWSTVGQTLPPHKWLPPDRFPGHTSPMTNASLGQCPPLFDIGLTENFQECRAKSFERLLSTDMW